MHGGPSKKGLGTRQSGLELSHRKTSPREYRLAPFQRSFLFPVRCNPILSYGLIRHQLQFSH